MNLRQLEDRLDWLENHEEPGMFRRLLKGIIWIRTLMGWCPVCPRGLMKPLRGEGLAAYCRQIYPGGEWFNPEARGWQCGRCGWLRLRLVRRIKTEGCVSAYKGKP